MSPEYCCLQAHLIAHIRDGLSMSDAQGWWEDQHCSEAWKLWKMHATHGQHQGHLMDLARTQQLTKALCKWKADSIIARYVQDTVLRSLFGLFSRKLREAWKSWRFFAIWKMLSTNSARLHTIVQGDELNDLFLNSSIENDVNVLSGA